jgi:hypothetical protein
MDPPARVKGLRIGNENGVSEFAKGGSLSVNLVVGATGSLGGRVTRGLLQPGKAVRILTRKNPVSEELAKQGRANTAQSLIEAGAQAVTGDLKHRAALDAACQGVEMVVGMPLMAGHPSRDLFEAQYRATCGPSRKPPVEPSDAVRYHHHASGVRCAITQ